MVRRELRSSNQARLPLHRLRVRRRCTFRQLFDRHRIGGQVAKRDAEIAKRGDGAYDAAEANAASDAGTGFDASTCVGVSGTEKDAAWCVASCGAPIKPDCPSTFCICEGDIGHDSSVRDGKADGELSDAAAATADAIAQRDAGIASRGAADSKDSAAGESAALSDPTFDGSSCHRVQEHRADQPGNNEDDDKWCRDHCGLVPPECPALFCKCDPIVQVRLDCAKNCTIGSHLHNRIAFTQ